MLGDGQLVLYIIKDISDNLLMDILRLSEQTPAQCSADSF